MPGADQFDAISEDHDPDRGADKVVAVDQGIDQQFFEHLLRHLQLAEGIEVLLALHMAQVALDEGQAAPVLLQQVAVYVFAV
ncbi:hypothetical protein [Pseudomonas sp. MWU13-2100]|uniref:hypothetical protein n=1 Tax=Pseudomonas sp. MWU13-2100 TaxID=2935075 RepID=UPI00399A8332